MPHLDPKHEEALRRLKDTKKIGVDVETSGLDWKRNHIVGYVLSFGPAPQDSYYLPVRHAGGGNIEGCSVPSTTTGWKGDKHIIEHEITKEISRQDVEIVGHNLAFDLKFLHRVGAKFDAVYNDTQINAVLVNELQSGFSLDTCSKLANVFNKKTDIYDYIAAKFPQERIASKGAMAHFWRLAGDDPRTVDYAISDGVSTWQLLDWQLRQIADQNLAKVHGVESRCIPVLARMMVRGIKIDIERLHAVKKITEEKRDAALASLPDGFNSRSPLQVRALMEKHNYTNWPLTEKGAPSFNEAWLLTNDIGRTIVSARKYSNLLASFIGPMLDDHMFSGRVYPDYNQLRGDEYGTITGRLSSSNPNLQQVNKRNKELGRLHRSIFVPDEGMIWGSRDYSQMEPRILAYYSRCKVLLDGYRANPPVDAHMAVAKAANIDRDTGKRVNQTLVTGGGKKVLVERYGIPADKVDGIWNAYFEAMPEIRSLQKRAANRMEERGHVLSLLGRWARLSDRSKSYVALNRLLQCGNADCLKVKMVELDDYYRSEGDRIHLLNNCHDAFETQFFEDDRKIYEESERIMCDFGPGQMITMDIPITVDSDEGPNWAVATWGPE